MTAVLALVLLAWTGVMLTWRYRPDGGGPAPEISAAADWSRRLTGWHEASLALAAVALVLWCALTLASKTHVSRSATIVVGLTSGALAMVGLTAFAWSRAQWDQLGLWAVTVGQHVRGLWYAAFSEQVRFVLIDGSGELDPSAVAPWVIAHLVAPFVALALLVVGLSTSRSARDPRRSIVTSRVDPAPDVSVS